MNQILIDALRRLNPSGRNGFEGLIAKLLEVLTGRHFHLAQAGTQLGRDMSASGSNTDVIAVECKRYGKDRELSERELLGEIVQVARAIPDLDLWVLVTSRTISSQLHESLRRTSDDNGIGYLSISIDDGIPSSLEVLCAMAIDIVLPYLKDELDKAGIHKYLEGIAASEQFNQKVERLKNEFSSPLIGYAAWQVEQKRFFLQCLQSKIESRAEFGQLINVEEEGVKLIKRETAWGNFNKWFDGWKDNQQILTVLGEEGDGKTWSVASWLSHQLKQFDGFPPILFLSSTSVSDNDPEILLSEAIAKNLPGLEQEQRKKRIKRWAKRATSEVPLFLIVLDGINERRNHIWWRTLLEKVAGQPWANQVAVLITCRSAYWKRHFEPLSHLRSMTYVLPSYDDSELDQALANKNLRRIDIQNDLLLLIRKPRYFDLMVKYREKIAETGDVTVERLIYEDWRDRLERKQNIPLLDDESFKEFICKLSRKSQEVRYVSDEDIDKALPLFIEDKTLIFEELQTGGIVQKVRNGYQVNARLLIYGFGLLLVNNLEEASISPEKDLSETIAEWLEPHAEMDIKAAICSFAALHALSLRDYSKQAKIVLLQTWVCSRNLEEKSESDFIAYLPIDPQCYIDLAEIVWSDVTENAWAQEILMQAFLRWRESPKVLSHLHSAFERWLSFVHIYGVVSQHDQKEERMKRINLKITDRMGSQPQAGQEITFGNYTITVIKDDGLLRLGRVALGVISHLPRSSFLHAISTGCLAEEIMGSASKSELLAWIFRSSPEGIWQKTLEEVKQLLRIDQYFAQKAAYRLLSYEGSQEAYQLRQTLPRNLVPINPWAEELKQDPCNSIFPWTQAECEVCLQRNDLSHEQIARKLKKHCINPNLLVPDDLGCHLEHLTETILIQEVRSALYYNEVDHNLDEYEPALCAYEPNAIVDLVRRITHNVEERSDLALHYLVFRLNEYSLVFRSEEQKKIYRSWKNLIDKSSTWNDKEKTTEAFLFKLILKAQTAEEQLIHFIERPENTQDLLAFGKRFSQINDWNIVRQYLVSGSTIRTIQRILWFLSSHPRILPKDISQLILPLLNHDDSLIRASVLQILYFLEDQELTKVVVDGTWAWNTDQIEDWQENHWGSLLLCKFATHLSYSVLHNRIHPKYLGYAIQCRGMIEDEIKYYSEKIQYVWSSLGAQSSDLLVKSSPLFIAADILEDRDILMIHQLSLFDSSSSQNVTFLSRESSWGGVGKRDSQDWEEIMNPNSRDQYLKMQKQNINSANSIIKQQREAGNVWFAQRLFPVALDQIVCKYPSLLDQWLNAVLVDNPESNRYLYLGYSFYEALCNVLLKITPDRGISLYWRLQETEIKINIKDEHSNIELLDYALFQASVTTNMEFAWQKKLEACQTDSELMEVAILAQSGTAGDWLWSIVSLGIKSTVAIEKSRALVLLAFIQRRKAFELINSLMENQSDTWMKDLLEMSRELWQRNDWAMHWFRRFMNLNDNVTAWTSFRLFLQCVDSRFWYWRHQIKTETTENEFIDERYMFLEDNLDAIKNVIKKNEKSLRERFIGHKVLSGQAYPWM